MESSMKKVVFNITAPFRHSHTLDSLPSQIAITRTHFSPLVDVIEAQQPVVLSHGPRVSIERVLDFVSDGGIQIRLWIQIRPSATFEVSGSLLALEVLRAFPKAGKTSRGPSVVVVSPTPSSSGEKQGGGKSRGRGRGRGKDRGKGKENTNDSDGRNDNGDNEWWTEFESIHKTEWLEIGGLRLMGDPGWYVMKNVLDDDEDALQAGFVISSAENSEMGGGKWECEIDARVEEWPTRDLWEDGSDAVFSPA